jgi:hypothetical protein
MEIKSIVTSAKDGVVGCKYRLIMNVPLMVNKGAVFSKFILESRAVIR